MSFNAGDFKYVAGNLASEPRIHEFEVKGDPVGVQTVVYMTVAVNHENAPTEYVELEARGKTCSYILEQVDINNAWKIKKGMFVMAGGEQQIIPSQRPGDNSERRKIRLSVFSYQTSLEFDVLTSTDKIKI